MEKRTRLVIPLLAAFLLVSSGCGSEAKKQNEEGLAYYAQGAYTQAISSFEKAIVADTQEPEYQVNKGMAHLQAGEISSAINCFDSAIRLDESYEIAYRGKGMAYLAEGSYEDAIRAFDQALETASGKVSDLEYDILFYRGEAQRKAGLFEDAIYTYTVLLETRGQDAKTYFLRGLTEVGAAMKEGDFGPAEADFAQAIRLESTNYSLYLNIYYAYSEYGRADLGIPMLQKALTIKDTSSASHKARGTIHFLLGDYSAALSELQYEEDKADTEMLITIGLCYQAQGYYDMSYSYFEKALNLGGETPVICYQMGMSMFSMADYEKAKTYFERSMELGDSPYVKEMKYYLGICKERLFDYPGALAAFREYVSVYGSTPEIEKEIQFLSTR